jgi:hypothetical protein
VWLAALVAVLSGIAGLISAPRLAVTPRHGTPSPTIPNLESRLNDR